MKDDLFNKGKEKNRKKESKRTSPEQPRPVKTPYKAHDLATDYINYLQQTEGNRRVQQMYESGELHAMLRISQANDPLEREADRVADMVVDSFSPDFDVDDYINRTFAASAAVSGKTVDDLFPNRVTGLSSGKALPRTEQRFFEERFGADFSSVRVHTGPTADQFARAINARAFTYKQDIVFADGEYAPGTREGRRLMAHELTHVLQKTEGVVQRESSPYIDGSYSIEDYTFSGKTPREKAKYIIEKMDRAHEAERQKPLGHQNRTVALATAGWQLLKKCTYEMLEQTLLMIKYRKQEYYDFLRFYYNYYEFLTEKDRQKIKLCVLMIEKRHITRKRTRKVDGEEFQSLKDTVFKIDDKLIEKFLKLSGPSWGKALRVLALGLYGFLYNKSKKKEDIRELDEALKKDYEFSVDQLGRVVLLFQNKALNKAEEMVTENIQIAKKEYIRYQDDTELDKLYKTLTKTYASTFNEADRLRAKALLTAYKNDDLNIQGLVMAGKPGHKVERVFKKNMTDLDEIAAILATVPSNIVEIVIFESIVAHIIGYNNWSRLNPEHVKKAQNIARDKLDNRYPQIKKAREKDGEILSNMTSDHPVLADARFDTRMMSREYAKKSPDKLRKTILKNLKDSIDSGIKTIENLREDPAKVWELVPLVRLTMMDEQISTEDKTGRIIWDIVTDTKNENTIRSIGMAAAGIALGIAGFFTGGATWAAVALGVGGAVISGIDLYYELESYDLHSNAAKATLGGELSKDPGVLGITMAIVGLVIDVADIGVAFMKAINKSAQIINDSSDIAKAAGKQYDELLSTGYLTRAVSKDDFIKAVKNAASSSGDEVTAGTIAKVNRILNANDIANANEVVHAGLRRLCQNNAEVCEQVVKQFAKNPDVLTRLSSSMLLNKHLPQAFSDVFTKMPKRQAAKVMEYFGREGANVVDELPATLKFLDECNITNPNVIVEYITDAEIAKWGRYLKEFKGVPPTGMVRPHAHHIVFKGNYSHWPEMQSVLNESRKILEKYGIDPLKGVDNLVWAPNIKGQHTIENARKVLDALKFISDNDGSVTQIKRVLQSLGKRFAQGRGL